MNFLVFIKQVPDSAEIRFDSRNKTLIRAGVKNEMNPYDRRAITEAIRYRTEQGGNVTAATMGPPQAEDALKEALIMGVDSCIHIQDSRLAGSDTLITARVLAAAAKRIGYDIIFCGQHSTDSETGQVPVELAELLGIPVATAVRKIEYLPNHSIQVTSETDEGSLLLEIPLPAVLTAAERLIKPLKTKNVDLQTAPQEKIHKMGLHELGFMGEDVGLEASPTWVADIVDVRVTRSPEIWDGSDAAATASKLLKLIQHNLKNTPHFAGRSSLIRSHQPIDAPPRAFWCWVEYLKTAIRPVSLEIISASASLASEKGGAVAAIVPGQMTPDTIALLGKHGADTIYHLASNDLHPDRIIDCMVNRIETERPFALFFPATSEGKYLAPRIAARLSLGLTGDCIGLEFTTDGLLAHLKPAFGGNIVAPIHSRTYPQMATLRPGAFDLVSFPERDDLTIFQWQVPEHVSQRFTVIAREIDPGIEAVKLDNSKFVVGVGAGLGQESVRIAERLAELLDGSVGGTRRVVDQGWLPRQFQIGLTGKFISPRIYLSLGVSGRYNHMIGVQKSNQIIAINHDPSSEIFKACDIGIHGDCIAITAEMIRLLETSKE